MKTFLKFLRWLIMGILALVLLILAYVYSNLHDRHSEYHVDLNVPAGSPAELRVGFARVSITPAIEDTWTDANGDSRYFPEDGDTFQDNNGNEVFDAYWIAGFDNRRPANGVHDTLWASTMVIDDGTTRLAIVAIDAIGFGSDDVINTRKQIKENSSVDYTIISSSHTHEAPDLLGIWGDSEFSSGVNPEYMQLVTTNTAKSVDEAVENMRPAHLLFAQDLASASYLVEDTRPPFVMDPGIRLIRAIDSESGASLGTLFSWANHPETLWDANLLLSSDFPHYVRHYSENGIFNGDSLIYPGLGGTTVYINGAIGGLMTSTPGMTIADPVTGETFLEPSFEKADAQGKALAIIGLNALKHADTVQQASIGLIAKSIQLPLDNRLFQLAASIGVLNRGMNGWFKMRSEISAFAIGPASFLMVPGEIYPEIINGGVEAPDGRDFVQDQIETPPLRSFMTSKYQFVIGLANDMVGYIVPKSQWDTEPPYTYNSEHGHYGEINSVSPEAAPIIYNESRDVLQHLQPEVR